MDGIFLNQKANQIIRISYSLKFKHLKKKIFFHEEMNGSVGCNKHLGEQH